MADPTPGIASWRDVATIVNDTRQELSDKIDNIATLLNKTITEWEHRITVVEEHSASYAVSIADLHSNVSGLYHLVGKIADQLKEDEAVEVAFQKRRLGTKNTVLALAGIVGMFGSAILGYFLH